MSRLMREGTVEPVSGDQILTRERGQQGNIHFSCLPDHEQDQQPLRMDHTLSSETRYCL